MSSTTISEPAMTRPATAQGFKDWAVVCAALGQGRQSLILRKGGIAEGRDGFRFKHEEFFLFPTQYHQQMEKVRPDELAALTLPPVPPPDVVEIRYLCRMEWAVWIDEWETLSQLAPFHIYQEEVLRERFEYDDQKGLQCAFGRVYALGSVWSFPDKPGYGGCRSWVQLPVCPPEAHLTPVLDDARHEEVSARVRQALGHFAAQLPTEDAR